MIVQGRLKQRSFDTREGDKRTVVELDVTEVGPALRYATATVRKATRNTTDEPPADDPWGAPPADTGVDDAPF